LLDTFKKVEINIPLLDAIKQISKYAKFMKELCTYKRSLRKIDVQIVSTLTQSHLPPKCNDPGTFTVPCTIGEITIANALVDLGASINVMPSSVYDMLHLGELKPTNVIIQLANKSTAQPLGVIEDVLVKVDQLIFPTDFYVQDMQNEHSHHKSTLILGRPFLMSAKTKIDVYSGTLSMEFGEDLVQFNIFEAMKHPVEGHSILYEHSVFFIDDVKMKNDVDSCTQLDLEIEEEIMKFVKDSSDTMLEGCNCNNEQCLLCAEINSTICGKSFSFANLELTTSDEATVAIMEAKTPMEIPNNKNMPLELKTLPDHLKYVFLDVEQRLPVIIASNLSK